MDALAQWLTSCLDEMHRVAAAATQQPWYVDWSAGTVMGIDTGEWAIVETDGGVFGPDPPDATHIALHDPRSVLARVKAERAVLRLHGRDDTWPADPCCTSCGDVPQVTWPCETLRQLAYGHRHDYPGYDPAWAPEGMED